MTDREDTEQLALAYVYGELDGDEAKQFEARLAASAELRAEVDGLIATREMLDADATWGAEQGLDDPPPHLVDAILRAEAIARPKEIRDAQRAAEQADKPWVQRLSLWIFGGGAALTAAAALLLFVGQESMTADEAPAMTAPVAQAAKAESMADAEEGAAVDRLEEEKKAPGGFAADAKADSAMRPAEEKPMADPAPEARRAASTGDGTIGGLATADESDADEGAAFGGRADDDFAAPAKPKPKAKDRAARSRTAGGESADKSGALNNQPARDQGLADGRGYAGGAGASTSGPADMPAPSEPMAEAEAAPAPKTAAPAPPPVSGALKKVLANKGAKKSKRRAPTTAKERKKTELKAQSQQLERQEQLTMEVATGQRELSRGRPANAIGPFTRARTLDPSGKTIGTSAVVGLMQAHHMLKAYQRVLDFVPLLMRFPLETDGVGEGLMLAADSAERLGQNARAEKLYADASKVKKTRARALRAMKRMKRAANFDMEDSAAAAEPPAAAEAAADEE